MAVRVSPQSATPLRTIAITLDTTTGDFGYDRATLRAQPELVVEWTCRTGDSPNEFAVHFGARTPFDRVILQSERGVLTRSIRPTAARGAYKYVVAVAAAGKVFIDACPEIIVDPPPPTE